MSPSQSLGPSASETMIKVDVQIHGYRKGHQLLSSSISLPKDDQMVIDRLSDVAGPLRPKELFSPYLSAYPLPSGTHYVIARTWQDPTVSRAGCVRTKSVLIDLEIWSLRPSLISILHLLSSSQLPPESDAVRVELEEQHDETFPPSSDFSANELLEALFLEDVKPVVVFDAPNPELIASRLLVALWPDIRRRFALSTFALSPRKISGRDLDLVFAPANAKAKFSDWPGRRVDGRLTQIGRHRWTGTIVRRIFEEPVPRLLSDHEINLLGERESDSTAALRVVLLWDELLDKLARTPTVALGLLDIANSGLVSNAAAMRLLEPRLAEATGRVAVSMPSKDAWDFVSALAQKIMGHDIPASRMALEKLAAFLAGREPNVAISLLQQPDPNGAINTLIPHIAKGLGNGEAPHVEQALVEAPADIIARLVSQGGPLPRRVAQDDRLIEKMGFVLTNVDRDLADQAGMTLLPFLIEDRHLSAALPILANLDSEGIAAELRWLRDTNGFEAIQLSTALIDRARTIGGLAAARDVLIDSGASPRRDSLLQQTVAPVETDVLWILGENRLPEVVTSALLLDVIRSANDRELEELFSNFSIAENVVARIQEVAADVLERIALLDRISINSYVIVILSVIPRVDGERRFRIAQHAIESCLRNRFNGDEAGVLSMLLDILGAQVDGNWLAEVGLGHSCDAYTASRNLVAFEMAPLAARSRIVGCIDEIVHALHQRQWIDLTEAAYDACSRLMLAAEKASPGALVGAATCLMPSLLHARHQPVSLLIAVLFPVIYRELGRTDDVPDFLRVFPFFDWDRCKTARRELVDSFMNSSWHSGDLALTAYRCGDVARILKRVVKSYCGEEYLARIENDLGRLGDDARGVILEVILEIRSNRAYKIDW